MVCVERHAIDLLQLVFVGLSVVEGLLGQFSDGGLAQILSNDLIGFHPENMGCRRIENFDLSLFVRNTDALGQGIKGPLQPGRLLLLLPLDPDDLHSLGHRLKNGLLAGDDLDPIQAQVPRIGHALRAADEHLAPIRLGLRSRLPQLLIVGELILKNALVEHLLDLIGSKNRSLVVDEGHPFDLRRELGHREHKVKGRDRDGDDGNGCHLLDIMARSAPGQDDVHLVLQLFGHSGGLFKGGVNVHQFDVGSVEEFAQPLGHLRVGGDQRHGKVLGAGQRVSGCGEIHCASPLFIICFTLF